MALKHFPRLDLAKTVHCFQRYMKHGKTPVSRAQFEANLALKLTDAAFRGDILPILAQDAPPFDVDEAGERVKTRFSHSCPVIRGKTQPTHERDSGPTCRSGIR